MMNNHHNDSLKRIIFILLVGLAPYWFMNATIWIPWVYLSRTIGIILMMIFVPIIWGYGAYYCYIHISFKDWKYNRWLIAILFLLSSAISDIFFFLIWRHLTLSELYHPSTIASYVLFVIIPFIVEPISSILYKKEKLKLRSKYNWTGLALFLLIFIIITLYCVRFW